MTKTILTTIAAALGCVSTLLAGELVEGEGARIPAPEWAAALGVDPAQEINSFSTDGKLTAQLIGAKEPTNILWPGEQPDLEIQLQNLTDEPMAARARVVVVGFETWTHDGEIFKYGVTGLGEVGRAEISIDIPAKGVQRLRIAPQIPERKGGYAVLLEPADKQPRLFLTSVARTFKPAFSKRRFYKLTMDLQDARILRRLGAAPNRIGFSPQPPSNPKKVEEHYQQWAARLREYADAGLPICIEFGHGAPHGGEVAPLGRNRPHLDDQGRMKDGIGDVAWLPEYDVHFTAFVNGPRPTRSAEKRLHTLPRTLRVCAHDEGIVEFLQYAGESGTGVCNVWAGRCYRTRLYTCDQDSRRD